MTALLVGVGSYLSAGIMSLLFSRYRFWFSLLGWAGAATGASLGISTYLGSGRVVSTLGEWGVLGIEIVVDQTTLLFVCLVVLLNFFTLIYLRGSKKGVFYCLYNFLLTSTFSLGFSHDLFNLYVTIEFMSLVSILLIGYERKAYQIYAGAKYLVISSLAMSLYLIGLGLVYRVGGHLGIGELVQVLDSGADLPVSLGLSLMLTGLAVKGGVFLFSMWLPDAHSYSDTVVSALLSGMAIKSGLIGLIRVSELINRSQLLLVLGALTGIAGAAFALLSHKPKKILAHSTISQVGYILLGIGIGTPAGILAATLHLFFHGLFKGLLFLSVGAADVGAVNIDRTGDFSVPWTSKMGLLVGSVSLMAIPPFSKYFSKTLLVEQVNQGWVWLAMLAIGLGTALYTLKLDWALIAEARTVGAEEKDFSVVVFAVAVGLSGFLAWIILGSTEVVKLLSPHHLIVYLAIPLVGGVTLFGFKERLSKISPSYYPFSLENSLVSLFTGFLLIEMVLLII
ncbi:MAG: complex I subunit 5 family protein [Candidatus Bipolaricaulia bacterium]